MMQANWRRNEREVRLEERIAELELAIEDQGWIKFSVEATNEFTRSFLRSLVRISRLYYLKNPLVNRGVSVQAYYVWGQGVSVTARDARIQAVIKAFMDDSANQTELTSHQARTMKEVALQVEGNIFFTFFEGPDSILKVRTIPGDQVVDIITDPDDAKSVWFYKRQWTENRFNTADGTYTTKQRTAYYPDWKYLPDTKPSRIGDDPIEWSAPVFHLKVGGLPDMRFGVPETYSALDWARAYKDFLEDTATLMRGYARFIGQMTVKGGATGVAAAQTAFNTTVDSDDPIERNPAPLTGSIFVSGDPETNFKPFQLRGANVNPEDGRRLLLMAAAALGIPETFFGDVSVGTLATARSLDRPTELKFRDRQTLWGDALHDILQYQIDRILGVRRSDQPLPLVAPSKFSIPQSVDRTITVSFPPILEHAVDEMVNSIVKSATLGGQGLFAGTLSPQMTVRLLLQALGEPDIDDKLKHLFPNGDMTTAESGVVTADATAVKPSAGGGQQPKDDSSVAA